MKTHQCPICGSKRTFLDIIPQGYQYICTQCGLCALRQFTPQEAAEAWNELVFKFPPAMLENMAGRQGETFRGTAG